MSSSETHAVTGAFGYSGKYIARRLLQMGKAVRTLTNSHDKTGEFQGRIEAFPLSFDDPKRLAESLRGVNVLYNTYWVRFNHRHFKHSIAGFAARIFFRQSQAGAGSHRFRPGLRHSPPNCSVWRRRHFDQQHRVDTAAFSRVRRFR